MSAFVDECRREWKRLGVPDALAEEMASELQTDLDEASAEGVSAPEILGESDPRSFAANWAAARGLIPDAPSPPRRRRTLWWIVAAAVLLLLIGGLTTLALVSTGTQTAPPNVATTGPPPQRRTVSLPLLLGLKASRARAILRTGGLRPQVFLAPHRRAGVVVTQMPAAGTQVARGSTVRLQVGAPRHGGASSQ